MEELDVIYSRSSQKILELENAAVPVPEDFLAHLQPASIDRQRRIFVNIPLAPSLSILEKYMAEEQRFNAFADTVVRVRDELEAMVRRTMLYHDFFGLALDFPHPELDSYIGIISTQDRTQDEGSYIARYISTRSSQLDAQKRYYLMGLWRATPQQLERVGQNAAAEWDAFCKSEHETRAGISDTIRMLKSDGREHHAALKVLEGFDAENDARIAALPDILEAGSGEGELAGAMASLMKCVQTRLEEFMALAALLRDDVARMAQMVEGGSMPVQARQKLLAAAVDFNDIYYGCGSPAIIERYRSAVKYYTDLLASRTALCGLCLQSIRSDISARCRELEGQDRRYAGLLATVQLRFDIPDRYGGPGVAELVSRYEEAQEHIYKETEGFISGFREAVLEGNRGRIARAQRTIVLDQMKNRLEAIAGFVPRRPASPAEDVAALGKMQQELFGRDLLADAQQYWMKVRELCEAISASIRIHLDFSMVTEEDRKAGWEAVLDRLDARFISILVTMENRLKELDSVLGQIPEFSDVRLAARPAPNLKICAQDELRLPALRLGYLEETYKAIHSARQGAVRQFCDLTRSAREGHLPAQFVSALEALATSDIDAALVGFAALRSSLRDWLRATIDAASKELDIPQSGKWEMTDSSSVGSWLGAFGEFWALFSQRARSAMEEAAALGESMAASEELGRIKRKVIGGCRMRELLEASDTAEMREMAYLLFHGEQDIEAARRDIELALSRHDLQGVLDGCRRWRSLQGRLEEIAVTKRDSWKATILEALGDLEDRRLREYNLSRNKAGFQDRTLIEDIQRAVLRCKLRDHNLTVREFDKLMRALHRSGQVQLTDRSDAMFMTPGEYPEYGLVVACSEREPDTECTAHGEQLCLEFTYQPKKMLLILKGS
jgi:hypothetical protein